MKKKTSLRFQITIILISFVLLILGLIYITQTFFLESSYKNNKIESIKEIGAIISNNLNNADIEDALRNISMEEEVCIRIITSEGELNDMSCPLTKLSNEEVSEIAYAVKENGGRKTFDNYHLMGPTRDDLYIYGQLSNYKNADALVIVSALLRPISATEKAIQSQYYIIVIIVIIMTLILAFILSRLLINPIKRIKKEAINLPKGKYDDTTIKPDNLEIDELNGTLKEANEEILKADRAKEELIGNVSHDLRTPLTMIIGYAEMIKDMPDEDIEKNADIIMEEAKRLSSLVDDLVDISNSELKNLKINETEISINDLLNNVHQQFDQYCKSHDVEFNLVLSDDIKFMADEKRLKQVLYNFIYNALNYNDKPKKIIELGVEKENDIYRIYVKDNGNGIKEKDIDKIWDRYYKVDKDHKRQHLGSGIGLALSKSILESMNLYYGVESLYNVYSKFYIDIKQYNK